MVEKRDSDQSHITEERRMRENVNLGGLERRARGLSQIFESGETRLGETRLSRLE